MKLLLSSIIALSLLAGCGTRNGPPVPPEVVTQTVQVAVPVRCTPNVGSAPVYVDTDDALAAARGDIFAQVRLLLGGRRQRIARLNVVEPALTSCMGTNTTQ